MHIQIALLPFLLTASAALGESTNHCFGDANRDRMVNIDDLLLALTEWGECTEPCEADFDATGTVGVDDLLAIIGGWGPCPETDLQVIFTQDFEHRVAGPYDEDMLDVDWNTPAWSGGVDDGRVSVVETDGGNKAVAVRYPEGEYGTSETGAQWKLMFDDSHDHVRLSYRLRFLAPFDFVRGGKLPGLIGGEGNTGGGIPDGTDGWSARMMWRVDGAAVQYVYHPDQPQHYGEDLPWADDGDPIRFEPGRWHEVVHEIRMNKPGQNNGSITCRMDGVVVLERGGMRFRDVDSFAIDGMYFSTFFGGGSSSWATTRDETIFFDDFRIESVSNTP